MPQRLRSNHANADGSSGPDGRARAIGPVLMIERRANCTVTLEDTQIAGGAGTETKAKKPTFKGTAYSGGEVWQWFGRVVIDLQGLDIPDRKLGLLRSHGYSMGDNPRLGIVEHAELRDNALYAEGHLLTNELNTLAAQHAADAKEGFPFELSIRAEATEIEFVGAGTKTTVNGREFEGPIHVFRQSRLREITLCELGADPHTDTEFEVAATSGRSSPMSSTTIQLSQITAAFITQNCPDVAKELAKGATEAALTIPELKAIMGNRPDAVLEAVEKGFTRSQAHEAITKSLSAELEASKLKITELEAKLKLAADGAPTDPVGGNAPKSKPTTGDFAGSGTDPHADWEQNKELRAHYAALNGNNEAAGKAHFLGYARMQMNRKESYLNRV